MKLDKIVADLTFVLFIELKEFWLTSFFATSCEKGREERISDIF